MSLEPIRTIAERGRTILNLQQYNSFNAPEAVCKVYLIPPKDKQYILRMLIREPFGKFKIPKEIDWLKPLLDYCEAYQEGYVGIKHPYCYLTVRSGLIESTTDDVWHVDGFSIRISHIPEQNYIWSNCYPTEWVTNPIEFPADFNPEIHNIHSYFQDYIENKSSILKEKILYCLDPYVIHRRQRDIPLGVWRTFVRVSYTPIPIMDKNNTLNPLLMQRWNRDGLKEFRNKLIDYETNK